MKLVISTPFEQVTDDVATRIYATTQFGMWCILPKHMDMVLVLEPGLLIYLDKEGAEQTIAVNGGTLVKAGDEIRIATRNAMTGSRLSMISEDVRAHFADESEDERRAQTSLARLEANIIRRLLALDTKHART